MKIYKKVMLLIMILGIAIFSVGCGTTDKAKNVFNDYKQKLIEKDSNLENDFK